MFFDFGSSATSTRSSPPRPDGKLETSREDFLEEENIRRLKKPIVKLTAIGDKLS